ncbi:hypothetical protein IFO70_01545 [Phormidium tenue FACHB-886]|nr:hypothetical protein [Phormidium tenue FACHB-886]
MTPDLLEATNDYWHKLNELEAAYQRGDVSLAEVDARVAELMAELGQARRAAFRGVWAGLASSMQAHWEVIMSAALLGSLTYAWAMATQAV